MQQDHRLAVTEHGVPDPDAVDRRIAALRRFGQARGRRQGQPLLLGIGTSRNQKDHKCSDSPQPPHLNLPTVTQRRHFAPVVRVSREECVIVS